MKVGQILMKAAVERSNRETGAAFPLPVAKVDAAKSEAVLLELDRILASRHFKSAGRSRQFLQYVVHQKLAGHLDRLKERTIGCEVFQRSPDYATGEDPVVRVQAGEVRRRLEQYYQMLEGAPPIAIKLPVGSYSPIFEWTVNTPAGEADSETPSAEIYADTHSDLRSVVLSNPKSVAPDNAPVTRGFEQQPPRRLLTVAICLLIVLSAVGVGFMYSQRTTHGKTVMEQFWSPVFATQQPVLICLAKPVVYRPSARLYKKYEETHPGTFRTEVDRFNHPLPIDPNEKVTWGDLAVYPEYGVAIGDAYAGVSMSGLFGKLGKPSQVRIGSNYSYEDLRNSPAVVVGAFNNRWTMDATASLHYAFVEQQGKFSIQEQTPGGHVWPQYAVNAAGETVNFAIVGRILDSKTGQFTAIVAGVDGTGTQAAAEFVSHPEYLEKGLKDAPADWPKRNLEVVIQTKITDSIAGPPQVVAAYYW